MAKMVLTSEYLSIATNDLSAYIKKAELVCEVEEKDVTTMSSLGWKTYIGGLLSGSISVEFAQDYAAAAIDSIMWPLFIAKAPVAFEVRPTSAVVGASNPKWTGNLIVKSWQAVGGGVGDDASVSATYPTSGAVTRAVA